MTTNPVDVQELIDKTILQVMSDITRGAPMGETVAYLSDVESSLKTRLSEALESRQVGHEAIGLLRWCLETVSGWDEETVSNIDMESFTNSLDIHINNLSSLPVPDGMVLVLKEPLLYAIFHKFENGEYRICSPFFDNIEDAKANQKLWASKGIRDTGIIVPLYATEDSKAMINVPLPPAAGGGEG